MFKSAISYTADVSPCILSPCKHGGTCVRQGQTQNYVCNCGPGVNGSHCETGEKGYQIWLDLFLICKNPFVSTSRISYNVTLCFESNTDIYKENSVSIWFVVFLYCHWLIQIKVNFSDIDECASNPCQNNGTCNDLINQYNCTCVAGYSGYQCQTGNKLRGIWNINPWIYFPLIH